MSTPTALTVVLTNGTVHHGLMDSFVVTADGLFYPRMHTQQESKVYAPCDVRLIKMHDYVSSQALAASPWWKFNRQKFCSEALHQVVQPLTEPEEFE